MPFTGVFKVTDGTPENTVSFLATKNGIVINNWKAQTHKAQDGGVWLNSRFSNGRRMVMRNWANVIETYEVDISGADMDITITNFRKLLGLLVLAGVYWISDYQLGVGQETKPFWIEAQGECETETRYAYIYDGDIPELPDPYDQPFSGTPSTTDMLNIFIEHGVWRDNPPAEADCLKTYSFTTGPGLVMNPYYPEEDFDTVTADVDATSLTDNVLWPRTNAPLTAGPRELGVRFKNITIPNAEPIFNAYIVLVSNYNSAIGETEAGFDTVYGELDANSVIFSTYANFIARTPTVANTTFLNWDIGTTAGQTIYIADVTAIVQEIVDLPGWVSGNAMTFQMYSPMTLNSLTREFAANNDPTYDKPVLLITYEDDTAGQYGVYIPTCLNNFAVGYDVLEQPDSFYRYDSSLATFSPNLITHPTVFDTELFPNPVGVGDRLYIGSDYPFINVVWNLLTAGDGNVTYVYKYSTAGGIAAGSITNMVEHPFALFSGLANTGTAFFSSRRPTDFAKNSTPGLPNKYWIVLEITAVTVPPGTLPTQTVKPIYSTNWPFWEVNETEVGGDIEAMMRFLLVQWETYTNAGAVQADYDHILIGTRKYDRGNFFTPYLNPAGNRGGISFAVTAPATLVTYPRAPSGSAINYAPAGVSPEQTIGTWTLFTSAMTQQWKGRYRVFVRSYVVGWIGPIGFRLQLLENLSSPATVITQTDLSYVYPEALPFYALTDLGFITLQNRSGLNYARIGLALNCVTTAPNTDINILDIILFPVDEAVLEMGVVGSGTFLYDLGLGPALFPGYQPYHDSTMPKEGPVSNVVFDNPTLNNLIYPMQTNTMGMTIEPRKRTRIFFLPWKDPIGYKGTEGIFDGRFERVQQYLNMRGAS